MTRIPKIDNYSAEDLFSVLWMAIKAQTRGSKNIEDLYFNITGHIIDRICVCDKKHPKFTAKYVEKKFAAEKEQIFKLLDETEGQGRA